jgi:formamidopyrimidine-DNA glycosylase
MPEICEVCIMSQFLSHTVLNKNIINIEILGGRYLKKDFDGFNEFKQCLPLKITKIDSKGKLMWFELLDNNNNVFYLINTFGLSGIWNFAKLNHSNILLKISSDSNNDNLSLYYIDPCSFGTFKFIKNINEFNKKIDSIGFDLLKNNFSDNFYCNNIEHFINKNKTNGNKKIINVLFDQTKNGIGSGLGNYLITEILYKSKLSPYRQMNSLSIDEIIYLAYNIKYTLKLCYLKNNTSYLININDFLILHSEMVDIDVLPEFHREINIKKGDFFKFNIYKKEVDPNNYIIKTEEIIKGRTTYWVPQIQI